QRAQRFAEGPVPRRTALRAAPLHRFRRRPGAAVGKLTDLIRRAPLKQRAETLAHGRNADGGGALAHEPERDQRVVADETERALAERRDDAVGEMQMEKRSGKRREQKTDADQRGAERHEQPRSEPVEGQTDQRRRERVDDEVDRGDRRAVAARPAELFEQREVINPEGAVDAAHHGHVGEAQGEDHVAVEEATRHEIGGLEWWRALEEWNLEPACSQDALRRYRASA